MVADSTENYLGFETDLQDLELGYLLQRADRRLEVFGPKWKTGAPNILSTEDLLSLLLPPSNKITFHLF